MPAMVFKNFGGIYQFVVEDAADLAAVDQLDAARWAATSAPVKDLHCDPAFLAFMDPEGKGRLRVAQLLEARNWLFERLSRRDGLKARSPVLVLEDLDGKVDAGRRLRTAAEHVISQQALVDKTRLSLEDLRAFRASYAKTLANGDGVVPPELASEPEVAGFIRDVMAVVGVARDASGLDGAGAAELEKFLVRGKAFLEWKARPESLPAIQVWADATAASAALVAGLDAKVEEYFLQCDLLAQEANAAATPRLNVEEVKALKGKDAAAIERYLSESPLATPSADGRLLLNAPVNPLYQARFDDLREKVLRRALPVDAGALTRAEWRRVKALFDTYHAWQKDKPQEPFEKVPGELLATYLTGPLPDRLRHFIGVDQAAGPEVEQMAQLEKLILLQRWLLELVNNFVNFSPIYSPSQNALVEMGSLVIDGRRLDFCVKVEDRAGHKKVASESLLFLVYCSITDKDGAAAAYEVAAPVTSGERGRLRVGKRGVFMDLHGREWDAVVVDVVENPISVVEAMKAPFRRASQFVSKKIEDLAGAQLATVEKGAVDHLDKGVTGTVTAVAGSPVTVAAGPGAGSAPASPAVDKPAATPATGGGLTTRDLLLGGGIAFAAIGSALAYVTSALANVKPLNLLGVVGGLVLAIALVSGFLGWLKLRRRDMSLLLEANGWAVNMHMKVTRPIGRIFTRVPPLPKGHVKDRTDAVVENPSQNEAEPSRAALYLLLFLVVGAALAVAWYYLDGNLPTAK